MGDNARPLAPRLPGQQDNGIATQLPSDIAGYIDQAIQAATSQLRGSGPAFQTFNSISALTPTYSGSTKDGACRNWIYKLETAYKLAGDGGMTDETKISYAGLRMKGLGEEWFSSLRSTLSAGSWSHFKQKLIARFDTGSEYAEGKLRSIRQEEHESLEDYYTRFMMLAANCYEDMSQWPQALYLYFVQGMTEGGAKEKVFERLSEGKVFSFAIESVINLEKTKAAFSWDGAAAAALVPRTIKKREDTDPSKKIDKLSADVDSLANQLGSLHLLMQETAKSSAKAQQANYPQRQHQHRYDGSGPHRPPYRGPQGHHQYEAHTYEEILTAEVPEAVPADYTLEFDPYQDASWDSAYYTPEHMANIEGRTSRQRRSARRSTALNPKP